MTERIRPLYEVVEARRKLVETVAKGKQGFGDFGIVELNSDADGVIITHGPHSLGLPFKDVIELRNLLTSMFPDYYDSEILPSEPAPKPEAVNE